MKYGCLSQSEDLNAVLSLNCEDRDYESVR